MAEARAGRRGESLRGDPTRLADGGGYGLGGEAGVGSSFQMRAPMLSSGVNVDDDDDDADNGSEGLEGCGTNMVSKAAWSSLCFRASSMSVTPERSLGPG